VYLKIKMHSDLYYNKCSLADLRFYFYPEEKV
jgi:hypothetical protein